MVGVVGSRRRASLHDLEIVEKFIVRFQEEAERDGKRLVVVSGGCESGADNFAEIVCNAMEITMLIHPVDRTSLPPYPDGRHEFTRRAHARNKLIARDSARALLALVSNDRTGGTENTISHYLSFSDDGNPRELVISDGKR